MKNIDLKKQFRVFLINREETEKFLEDVFKIGFKIYYAYDFGTGKNIYTRDINLVYLNDWKFPTHIVFNSFNCKKEVLGLATDFKGTDDLTKEEFFKEILPKMLNTK